LNCNPSAAKLKFQPRSEQLAVIQDQFTTVKL